MAKFVREGETDKKELDVGISENSKVEKVRKREKDDGRSKILKNGFHFGTILFMVILSTLSLSLLLPLPTSLLKFSKSQH